MDTKVVHHTYPGTMSATLLASLQPMQQLNSKFLHQKPGFQSSRDWKEKKKLCIYMCVYVSLYLCGFLLSDRVPLAWGLSNTWPTHRLPKHPKWQQPLNPKP